MSPHTIKATMYEREMDVKIPVVGMPAAPHTLSAVTKLIIENNLKMTCPRVKPTIVNDVVHPADLEMVYYDIETYDCLNPHIVPLQKNISAFIGCICAYSSLTRKFSVWTTAQQLPE